MSDILLPSLPLSLPSSFPPFLSPSLLPSLPSSLPPFFLPSLPLTPSEPSCGALVGRYHHTFLSRFRCLRRSSLGQNNIRGGREGGREGQKTLIPSEPSCGAFENDPSHLPVSLSVLASVFSGAEQHSGREGGRDRRPLFL